MDHHERSREEILAAAKKKARGPLSNPNLAAHRKRRSHSRGNSISHIKEIAPAANSETTDAPSSVAITVTTASPQPRPGSHHRRRSSVSTRRESAEMMGVSVPEPPVAEADKDDVRRLALWTLEGKNSSPLSTSFGFSKVEIPDWKTPDVEKRFDFPPTAPLGITPSLAGKRDSFGKLLASSASSSKVELGTLVEEDEDENGALYSPVPPPPPTPVRHRPTSLNLRPLSLTIPLPTPSPTPPLRSPGRLRELTLATAQFTPTSTSARRLSPPSTTPTEHKPSPHRQSTILYISSSPDATKTTTTTPTPTRSATLPATLPSTPPASEHRRSLSPSEQEHLFQSQSNASLLARIADLEAKLATSEASRTNPPPAPSEELLNMVAELKAERDELHRDVAGWRVRTGDLEKQIVVLSKRVEAGQRDVWAAEDQVKALRTEKVAAEAALRGMEEKHAVELSKREQLQTELDAQKAKTEDLERELHEVLRTPTVGGLRRIKSVQSVDSEATEVDEFEPFAGPAAKLLRLKAKVLSSGVGAEFGVTPMDVLEEEEEEAHGDAPRDVDDEEEDPLAGYEDEGSEGSFHSGSHSVDSSFSFPRPHSPLPISAPMSAVGHDSGDERMPPPPPPPVIASPQPTKQSHARRSSMTKDWTFPRGAVPKADKAKVEVDKFFTCLDDSPSKDLERPVVDSAFASDASRIGFGFGFGFGTAEDDDDFGMPPFVLPAQQTPSPVLEVVMEEEEEEDEAFTFPIRPQTPPLFTTTQSPETPSRRPALTIATNADPLVSLSPPGRGANNARLSPAKPNKSRKPEAEQLRSFSFPRAAHPTAPAPASTSRRSQESENKPIDANAAPSRFDSSQPIISRIPKPVSSPPAASKLFAPKPVASPTEGTAPPSKLPAPAPKAKAPPVLFMPQPSRSQTMPLISPDSRATLSPSRLPVPTQPNTSPKNLSPVYFEHKPRSSPEPSPVPDSPLKIGLATLTSFLPLGWSPRQKLQELQSRSSFSAPSSQRPPQESRWNEPRGFVSRDKQLQRLKHETATARNHDHKMTKVGCDQCSLCQGKPIYI